MATQPDPAAYKTHLLADCETLHGHIPWMRTYLWTQRECTECGAGIHIQRATTGGNTCGATCRKRRQRRRQAEAAQ